MERVFFQFPPFSCLFDFVQLQVFGRQIRGMFFGGIEVVLDFCVLKQVKMI